MKERVTFRWDGRKWTSHFWMDWRKIVNEQMT